MPNPAPFNRDGLRLARHAGAPRARTRRTRRALPSMGAHRRGPARREAETRAPGLTQHGVPAPPSRSWTATATCLRSGRSPSSTIWTRAIGPAITAEPCSVIRIGGLESADEPPLPGRFHRVRVVVLPDVGHRVPRRHAVQDRNAGQGRAGPAAAALAGDLHSLGSCAPPRLPERLFGIAAIRGEPEVRPPDPAHLPGERGRLVAEQINGEVGVGTGHRRATQAAAA
jgi:hypothetical protein